jgi:DNA-binding winged helix-turn-helix (wHTH) protein
VPSAASIDFPPFRLDGANEQVWRATQPIVLRPKTFAVLRCLIEHAGQLQTKAELLDAVWPDTAVSDVALTVCIRELRRALDDDVKQPRYIETVHRRGYRFIAPVRLVSEAPAAPLRPQLDTSSEGAELIVGREADLAQLHEVLDRALHGTRQMVFISGEAGLGKTTLVETFLSQTASRPGPLAGRGQCIEQYDAGEAYLPVLQALERLCRAPGGQAVVDLLARYAPSWLVQLPGLLDSATFNRLHHASRDLSRSRMLREMASALEVLSAPHPLVLVVEDLHWSDHATLELLSLLARRPESARLLVLGTYRAEEISAQGHPLEALVRDLRVHGYGEELTLAGLSEAAVQCYVAARCQDTAVPPGWGRFVHQRTQGNPLFMMMMVQHLLSQGLREAVESVALPESLQQFLSNRQSPTMIPMIIRFISPIRVSTLG